MQSLKLEIFMSHGKTITTILTSLLLLMVVNLIGCSPRPCSVPPESRRQICLELKRQLIFYNSDPNHYYASWNSPTRQAFLLRRYREYNCENVLRECPLPCALQNGE